MNNEKRLYDTILRLNKEKEIINWSVELDPLSYKLNFFDIRKSPVEYIEAELEWYLSENCDVTDIEKKASLWSKIKSKDNKVNSNYGYLIYSKDNGRQYHKAIEELKSNKESRRAVMVYMPQDIWDKYNYKGMNDFICTFNTHLFIRNNKLYYIVNQRSCDFIYGFFNDFAWHQFVYSQSYIDLFKTYPDLDHGSIYYNAGSLHIYPNHYEMIAKIAEKIKGL